MNAFEDAWASTNRTAVAYLDADLIMTGPTLHIAAMTKGEVIVTPHYYPSTQQHLVQRYGYYNAGFIFSNSDVS